MLPQKTKKQADFTTKNQDQHKRADIQDFSLGVFALLFLNRKNSTVNNVEKVKLFVKTLKKATECGMIYKNIFV